MTSWPMVPLLTAVADNTGGHPKVPQSEYKGSGRYPIIDQGRGLIAGYTDDPQLLYGNATPVIIFGDHTRCFKYVDFRFCAGADGVKVLRPQGGWEPKFLYYYLSSMRIPGAGYSRHFKFLKEQLVPQPPLREQRRIVEVLDRADELRLQRRKSLAHLDKLPQSTFFEMFGDLATPHPHWPFKRMGEVCVIKGGKRLPKGAEYSSAPTGYRYIRVTDLREGEVDESSLLFLHADIQKQIARYTVRSGDVVISIAGSIGLVARVPESLDGVNLTENAARLTPRQVNEYDSKFMAHLLRSPGMQRQIAGHVGQVTIGKLALFKIERLQFSLPPIAQQQVFAERATAISDIRSTYRNHMSELDKLFAALQARAFRGEL